MAPVFFAPNPALLPQVTTGRRSYGGAQACNESDLFDEQAVEVRAACGTPILISMCDRWLLSARLWRVREMTRGGLYVTGTDGTMLHRTILGAPKGLSVDHRDGNGLNNCRANLRLATGTQNQANKAPRTALTGVRKARSGRWTAIVVVGGLAQHLISKAAVRRIEGRPVRYEALQ